MSVNGRDSLGIEEFDPDLGIDLLQNVRLIEGIVGKLHERLDSDHLRNEIGQVGALAAYLEIKALVGQVRDLQNEAERILIGTLDGERRVEIEGATVEVRRSYNRKWDHPLVLGAIAASALQGERIPEVDEVVTAITHCIGASTQWKTTALKDMGIDDQGYCQRELGRETVSVT